MSRQLDLFASRPSLPNGLAYRPELIDEAEERRLAEQLGSLAFQPFEFGQFVGKRRVVSFGWRYAFDGTGLHPAEPMPAFLETLRGRSANFARLAADTLEHALVTEYEPGAVIGWHRDRAAFGEVIGVSLLAPARLRFRRRSGTGWERAELELEPRSAYHLSGEARSAWEHSIPALDTLRYSITFRTVRS
jgi:alkylated DNA repair dioxygenase AlkB